MRTPDDAFTAGAVRASDELLDRLGRRRPTTGDLDDPVAASLALFAGEVDLDVAGPGPLRRVLMAEGLWPPVLTVGEPGEPGTGPCRKGPADSPPGGGPIPPPPHPRPPAGHRSGEDPLLVARPPDPSFPPGGRLGPRRWDRTELVLLTTGLALMAGGIALMFTDGLFHHIFGHRPSVVQEIPLRSSPAGEGELHDLLDRARDLARTDPAAASALLDRIEQALPGLDPRRAGPLAEEVARTRRLLPAGPGRRSAPSPTGPTASTVRTGPTAPSVSAPVSPVPTPSTPSSAS